VSKPKLVDTPWGQLERHLQRVLRWLNSCTLLTAADLSTLAWPEGATRQNQEAAIERWCDAALIQQLDDGITYQLGPVGVRKLREANLPIYAPTTELHPRVHQGILLASRFAVGLWADLLQEVAVGGFDWLSQPFRGEGARADGEGVILYSRNQTPCPRRADDLFCHDIAPSQLTADQKLDQLLVEIDTDTENVAQLRERARAWHNVIPTLLPLPPRTGLRILWVTTGGWHRAGVIWQTWIDEARCPLWVTTLAELQQADGSVRPWRALWRDEHGRPRTLNPWQRSEMIWRYEPSPEPAATTFDQAIAAWNEYQVV
jgi:hypothetical protein